VDRGRLHHLGLVEVRGQPGNEVQAGGDAGGTQFGEALSESGDESVAPALVDGPQPPQVPVELAPSPTSLRHRLDGDLLIPGAPGYDESRSVWNAMIDRRPAAIARCQSSTDVVASVRFAREHDLEVGVRCGGHNIAGLAVPDGGLMIDLRAMGAVTIDPERRRARVQGGALLGALDRAAQRSGLTTTAGNVSHTGVGGLTLCSGACAAAAATSGSSPISGWPELALSAPREATFTATITGDRLELGYVWVGDPVCGARLLPALRALGRPVAEQVTMPSYLELQRRDDSDEGHAQRRYW
jgi:hypothetical protein